MAKYRKLEVRGRGSFGVVWVCMRRGDRRRYAMKRLDTSASQEAKERFRREVRMLSKLDHPNVVEVLGRRLRKEPYFYVMPLYKLSLEERLGAVVGNESRIAKVFTAVLDGVAYAHREGVVHRDLKPANILMNSFSDVVVADFGLGLKIDPESSRLTLSGHGMGTAWYMAPEQGRDARNADERADVFALGRILDELYRGPIAERQAALPDLPPGIDFLVRKCTEELPERRFQSVAELKDAYMAVVDARRGDAQLTEFMGLRAQLSEASSGYVGGMLDRFLALFLVLRQEEEELLVDTMLALHPNAIAALFERSSGSMGELINGFCEEVGRRGWPFSYTDRLSDGCLRIFEAVREPQVRATLAACLVSLGTSHNRWKVLRDAASIIHGMKRPEEVVALLGQLSTASESDLEYMAQYVSLRRVAKPLRPLFKPS